MKIGCLKIGCLLPIILIVIIISIAVIVTSQLSYKDSISSILGLENVEVEFIDKARTWTVHFEVYKLLDKDVSDFLEKPNKTLYDVDGYLKQNWSRASSDSLITSVSIFARYNNTVNKHIESMSKLYYNNSYYALHYRSSGNSMILYILDEKNKLIYITSYAL